MMAETEARFLAAFYSSLGSVLVFVMLPELRVLSRSPVPRETPLPLNAVKELFFSSSGADLVGALWVAVWL
jgi:hypothetical protein